MRQAAARRADTTAGPQEQLALVVHRRAVEAGRLREAAWRRARSGRHREQPRACLLALDAAAETTPAKAGQSVVLVIADTRQGSCFRSPALSLTTLTRPHAAIPANHEMTPSVVSSLGAVSEPRHTPTNDFTQTYVVCYDLSTSTSSTY